MGGNFENAVHTVYIVGDGRCAVPFAPDQNVCREAAPLLGELARRKP